MNTHKKIPPNGFTIIEMMIYGGILSLFVIILTNMFMSILESQLGAQSTAGLARDGRYLLSRFSYDISRASSVSIPAALGSQSSTLTMTIDGILNVFALNSENLEISNANGTDMLNSFGTTVSGLTFTRIGNIDGKNSIRVSFVLTSTTSRVSGADQEQFQTTISLR